MSALAAVFGPAASSSGRVLQDMLGALRHRASGEPEIITAPGAAIAAARHDWEATLSGWSGPLIAEDDEWIVAADATLYYLADLRRALRLTRREPNTAELLLHALRMWGPRFGQYVEGDYAIIAWQRRRERLLLARDFGGRRNLAWARANGSVVVSSSADAVVRHPDVSREVDRGFIAASASAVIGPGYRTGYRQVAVVPHGATLLFEGGHVHEADRWTPPPSGTGWEKESSPAADEELRQLLFDATRERLDPSGPTIVWMSGGWDSTSIFASACAALDAAGVDRSTRPVLPVSLFYPGDDLGNEESYIRAISEHWRVPVRWVDSDQIPLIAESESRALKHDDPMGQPFEGQMRTLSQVTRELNGRVALDGFGGDQIFHASSAAVIADHAFHGRWNGLVAEWRGLSVTAREFVRLAVLPHLSPQTLEWIGAVRGRPLSGFWERGFPPWILPTPEALGELVPEFEQLPDESASQFEIRQGSLSSIVGRNVAWNMAFGLDEGVQLRAPLFDRRVVAFAVARPMSDRGSAGDSKRILRRAMNGLLPEWVLAPRSRKTGTPRGYFHKHFPPIVRREVDLLFGTRKSNLEALGILDRAVYMEAVERYALKGEHVLGALIQRTLDAERWLAVRSGEK